MNQSHLRIYIVIIQLWQKQTRDLWLNENVIFPAHWIIFTQKTFEEKYKLYNTNIITRIKIVASRFE